MTNPETHTCPTCGYTWKHGRHGGHSCSDRLVQQRDELIGMLYSAHKVAMSKQSSRNEVIMILDEAIAEVRGA